MTARKVRLTAQTPRGLWSGTIGVVEAEASVASEAGDETADEARFSQQVLTTFQEMFWDPEIERRGGLDVTGPIFGAIAILHPGMPVEVRLNEECEVVARARPGYVVSSGESVTIENAEAIESRA